MRQSRNAGHCMFPQEKCWNSGKLFPEFTAMVPKWCALWITFLAIGHRYTVPGISFLSSLLFQFGHVTVLGWGESEAFFLWTSAVCFSYAHCKHFSLHLWDIVQRMSSSPFAQMLKLLLCVISSALVTRHIAREGHIGHVPPPPKKSWLHVWWWQRYESVYMALLLVLPYSIVMPYPSGFNPYKRTWVLTPPRHVFVVFSANAFCVSHAFFMFSSSRACISCNVNCPPL